jgi:hypothetical protein
VAWAFFFHVCLALLPSPCIPLPTHCQFDWHVFTALRGSQRRNIKILR